MSGLSAGVSRIPAPSMIGRMISPNRDGKLDPADYYSGVAQAAVITAGRISSDKGADLVIGTYSGIETYVNKR